MNTLLTKHIAREEGKTQEESIAAFQKMWENSRYLLRPLKAMLKERLEGLDLVKETDFETPNHYAKLMFREGKKQETQLLLSLLPKSLGD